MILVLFSVVNKIANDYSIRVLSFKLNYFRYKNIFESNFHHKISERTNLTILDFGCKDFRLERKQGRRENTGLFSSQSKI